MRSEGAREAGGALAGERMRRDKLFQGGQDWRNRRCNKNKHMQQQTTEIINPNPNYLAPPADPAIIFETQMSQQHQGEDRELAPWHKQPRIPKNNHQFIHDDSSQRAAFNKSIMATIKHNKINLPENRCYAEQKCALNPERVFRIKASDRYREIIRKSLEQRRSSEGKAVFEQRAKQVNINSIFETLQPRKNQMLTSLEIGQMPDIEQKKQCFHIRKPVKKTFKSTQHRPPASSQHSRYDIIKTQQIFYRTLELTLPLRSTQQANSLTKSPNKMIGRPKVRSQLSHRQDRDREENQQAAEHQQYAITGEGMNLHVQRSNKHERRDRFRQRVERSSVFIEG